MGFETKRVWSCLLWQAFWLLCLVLVSGCVGGLGAAEGGASKSGPGIEGIGEGTPENPSKMLFVNVFSNLFRCWFFKHKAS